MNDFKRNQQCSLKLPVERRRQPVKTFKALCQSSSYSQKKPIPRQTLEVLKFRGSIAIVYYIAKNYCSNLLVAYLYGQCIRCYYIL